MFVNKIKAQNKKKVLLRFYLLPPVSMLWKFNAAMPNCSEKSELYQKTNIFHRHIKHVFIWDIWQIPLPPPLKHSSLTNQNMMTLYNVIISNIIWYVLPICLASKLLQWQMFVSINIIFFRAGCGWHWDVINQTSIVYKLQPNNKVHITKSFL